MKTVTSLVEHHETGKLQAAGSTEANPQGTCRRLILSVKVTPGEVWEGWLVAPRAMAPRHTPITDVGMRSELLLGPSVERGSG